jgi:outer membrane protein assembly factor BamB
MTLPLSEEWRTQIYIPFTQPPQMASADQHLIVTSRSDDLLISKLLVYDTFSGKLEWEIDQLPIVDILVADRQKVYVGVQNRIRAYDLNQGNEIWRSEQLPTSKIYRMEINDGSLMAYYVEDKINSREQVIQPLDTEKGTLKDSLRTQIPPNTKLLCNDANSEFWVGNNMIWARDSDGHVLWESEIESPIYCESTPDNQLIVQSGQGNSRIYTIDSLSGQVIWKYLPTVISNIGYKGNVIFAIREDGNLVGIGADSGQEVGVVKFSQPRLADRSISEAYILSIDEDELYAYWGDSQEVIAFKLSSSE